MLKRWLQESFKDGPYHTIDEVGPELHGLHEPGEREDSFSYGPEYLDFGKEHRRA